MFLCCCCLNVVRNVRQDFASLNAAFQLGIKMSLWMSLQGEKRREQSGPNEIVACTSCAGDGSPCTHSATNNGCATEVILYFNGSCSLQKRWKFIIDYYPLEAFPVVCLLRFLGIVRLLCVMKTIRLKDEPKPVREKLFDPVMMIDGGLRKCIVSTATRLLIIAYFLLYEYIGKQKAWKF